MKLPPQVETVLALLEASDFEAFLVGGAVRDYVMGKRAAKDWDIATSALPQQVKAVFSGYHLIETGLKHGTVTVVVDHQPIEITTYRTDSGCPGPSLRADLERRDFTMNALAYNPRTGVVDLVGGTGDIEKGIVRCTGDPDRRFREDGLRILRALRFASVYGMEIDAATADAIRRNQSLLRGVAAERIQTELTGILCGKNAAAVLRGFAGVLAVPLPELAPMFGFAQHNPHHDKDVWNHTVAVVENVSPQPVLRWAALLHDVGKPLCFSRTEDGVGHFFGHAQKSALLAGDILSRLRFDNAGRERIVRLVRHHDMPITVDRKLVKRLLSKHGEEAARQLIELHRADTLGQSDICQYRLGILDEVDAMLEEFLKEERCFSLKDLAVDGNDMIKLGLKGRDIGRMLQECLNAVLDERIPNERAALLAFAGRQACPTVQPQL